MRGFLIGVNMTVIIRRGVQVDNSFSRANCSSPGVCLPHSLYVDNTHDWVKNGCVCRMSMFTKGFIGGL